MMSPVRLVLVAVSALFASAAIVGAQEPPSLPGPPGGAAPLVQKPIVPLKVDFVISRFHGEKKISSLPFSMFVNANELRDAKGTGFLTTNLRMTVNVPVVMQPARPEMSTPFTLTPIGTNIDCAAEELGDGRFRLYLTVDDTTLVPTDVTPNPSVQSGMTTVRRFNTTNRVTVRPGQALQFTAATDVITGEVVRIEVLAVVIK